MTFLEQGETGLFQCTARCVVVSLRRSDDDLNIRIPGEDRWGERGDRGRSDASSTLVGFTNEVVDACCRVDVDSAIPVGVVCVPVTLDQANGLAAQFDDEHSCRDDTVDARLEMARSLGATPIHASDEDAGARVKAETGGRGADVTVEAVGHPIALETACRLARKGGTVSVIGVYAERAEVHMGIVFIKGLRLVAGLANVIAHLDPVLALMAAGRLDPTPLVTREMKLTDAADAYEAFDRRDALKILLRP